MGVGRGACLVIGLGLFACATPSTVAPPEGPLMAPDAPRPIGGAPVVKKPVRQRVLSTEAARAALQAELHVQAGDVVAAAEAWRVAARADESSPYLHVRLGEILLLVGDAAGAADAANKAIELCRDGRDDDDEHEQGLGALRLLAQARTELGDSEGSERALRDVLASVPGDGVASAMLAERLVARGALDEAEEVVVAWLRTSLGVGGAVTLAMVFADRGQIDRALIHLERALEKEPDSVEALQAKLTLLWSVGRFGDAVDVANAALRAAGDTEESRSTFVTAVGLAAPPAVVPLVTAMVGDDASERERLLVADALERAGLLGEAIAVLRPREGTRPSPLVLLELARLHLAKREPEGTIALACRLADALSPADFRLLDHATALCARAELERGGDDDADRIGKAVSRLVHVATTGPARARPLYALAAAVERAGRAGAVGGAVAVAVQTARERVSAEDVDAALAAASILSAAALHDEAVAAIERILTVRPTDARVVLAHARALELRATTDAEALAAVELVQRLRDRKGSDRGDDVDALNFMAFTLADRGLKPAEARALALQAVLRDPTNGYVLDTLGWAQLKDGDACGAVTTLRRADRLAPLEGELWFHIGAAEQACGNREEAKAAAARALTLLSPTDPLRTRVLALVKALEST